MGLPRKIARSEARSRFYVGRGDVVALRLCTQSRGTAIFTLFYSFVELVLALSKGKNLIVLFNYFFKHLSKVIEQF